VSDQIAWPLGCRGITLNLMVLEIPLPPESCDQARSILSQSNVCTSHSIPCRGVSIHHIPHTPLSSHLFLLSLVKSVSRGRKDSNFSDEVIEI
jgi:hypothetical protein